MNLAKVAIEKKVITIVLTLVMLGGGLISFSKLGMLEDSEFTIKAALVITQYPGASAVEVEKEVSDKLELAVQKMGQLDEVTSRSVPGAFRSAGWNSFFAAEALTLSADWLQKRQYCNNIQKRGQSITLRNLFSIGDIQYMGFLKKSLKLLNSSMGNWMLVVALYQAMYGLIYLWEIRIKNNHERSSQIPSCSTSGFPTSTFLFFCNLNLRRSPFKIICKYKWL